MATGTSEYWSPWVTKTNETSATINWHQAANEGGVILFSNESHFNTTHSYDHTISYFGENAFQHINLTGLQSDTVYRYWVQPSANPEVFPNGCRFQTMPENGPFSFVVISDSHAFTYPNRFKVVADSIANESDILFILHGGDYAAHDDTNQFGVFFNVSANMLSKYTIYPSIGNHEYHDPSGPNNSPTDAQNYRWAFDMPLNYSFSCSGVRFIILRSSDPTTHAPGSDDPLPSLTLVKSESPWLEELLEPQNNGVFTIHHHPIWNERIYKDSKNLTLWDGLYKKYHISASFAGHWHSYQHLLEGGVPYMVCANAGGEFIDLNGPYPPGYISGYTRQLGYLKVTVYPEHNIATMNEIFVGYVNSNSEKDPIVYKNPIVKETFTIPLKPESLHADFAVSPDTGTPPLMVQFSDLSTGHPTSWNWTFGDGSISHEQNPTHIYSGIGRYKVTLEVGNDQGQDIIRKPEKVTVKSGIISGPNGFIWVTSIPSESQVYIDGMFIGKTPLKSSGVPVGIHQITVSQDGFNDWIGYIQTNQGVFTYVPKVILRKV